MKLILVADGRTASGGAPLVVHNDRMCDPLDPIVRAKAMIARKHSSKKTDADYEAIAHHEFVGAIYSDPKIADMSDVNGQRPVIPTMNALRCLAEGATAQKKGKDVARGIRPLVVTAPLVYPGPETVSELWLDPAYRLRKAVGVGRSARITTTRPIFSNWQLEVPVEVDPAMFNRDQLASAWDYAGRYVGLGEMRPYYGTFKGTVKEAK